MLTEFFLHDTYVNVSSKEVNTMPRIYLSDEARTAAQEERELGRLSELVRTCKGRTYKKDADTAREAQISPGAFYQLKRTEAVAKLNLLSARRLAHAVGCTKEDWLRIGGFE